MNLGIEIGHVVIYARVADIDFENCDDNVAVSPRAISPRNWSPGSSSYRGIENSPAYISFFTFLRDRTNKGPTLRDLYYFDNIEILILGFWFQVTFRIDILSSKIKGIDTSRIKHQ